MIGLKRKPPLTLVLVVLMLFLLPLLAYEQYEWLGKVSDSDREQMKGVMSRSAAQFRDDFDREITRIHESFQFESSVEPPPGLRPPPSKGDFLKAQLQKDYADQYSNWVKTAPYPKLISGIYLIAPASDGKPGVERFNIITAKFDEIEWPADLLGLRDSPQMVMFRIGKDVPPDKLLNFAGASVNASIPAVIVRRIVGSLMATVVLKLDLDFIQKEFIPALVRRDLSTGAGGPDYNISIVDSTNPPRVIYSSAGSAGADLKSDVSTGILTARPFDYGASIPRMTTNENVFERRSGDILHYSSTAGTGMVQLEIRRNTTAMAGPLATTGVFAARENNAPWQLMLQHHAGSVDAAVAQARQRNLAIGFSILLLLAMSIGLIVMSAQRERRLAQQQMEFVSTVSHELRTPLAVICSAAENLADGIVREGEQTRQYGALVRNEGRRLADMVEQILDFSGNQSPRKAARLKLTDVAEVVDRALDMFALQIHESGVIVEKRIASGLPQIMADSPALVRALQNLVSNGLKYGKPGNWLAVRAEVSTDSIHLIVEDHGSGISPADLPHIFEPFYRGRAVIDAQIKGSGLGLSLVQQIVELHHAKITVHSDPASGSSFTIALPLRGSAASFVGSHDQAYSSR